MNRDAVRATALAFLCPVQASGQELIRLGDEFQINQFTTNRQRSASVSHAPDGSFVVVWHSNGQDGAGDAVFGRRYASDGMPQGDEFQVNQYTTNNQRVARVSQATDGSFVVVWESYGQGESYHNIFGRRFAGNGMAQTDEFLVNQYTTGDQRRPSVAHAPDGSFVVTWHGAGQDASGNGVFARRYASNGTAVGGEFQVNSTTAGDQRYASLSRAADGRFVVVWESPDENITGVYGRRFTNNGVAEDSDFRISVFTTAQQRLASVSHAPDGSSVVAWQGGGGQDGQVYGIFGRRYASNGAELTGEFGVNTYTTNN
jgi:hypothetical protein